LVLLERAFVCGLAVAQFLADHRAERLAGKLAEVPDRADDGVDGLHRVWPFHVVEGARELVDDRVQQGGVRDGSGGEKLLELVQVLHARDGLVAHLVEIALGKDHHPQRRLGLAGLAHAAVPERYSSIVSGSLPCQRIRFG